MAGLRSEVERRGAAVVVDFHFPTAAGEGLVADLASEDVVDPSYGLPS